MSVNKCILVGNLGKDPEIRYTPSGAAVATFSLATTSPFQDREGNKQTEWHNIVAWRKLAEICGEYLHKGKQVYIEGRIQTRSYDDRDGNKRYTTEIIAERMQMLGSREDQDRGHCGGQPQGGGNIGGQPQQQKKHGGAAPQQGGGFSEPAFNPDDEIPF